MIRIRIKMIWKPRPPEPIEELDLVAAQLLLWEESALVHAQTEEAATLGVCQLVLLALKGGEDNLRQVRLLFGADHWERERETE